jgi:hypothetical protein
MFQTEVVEKIKTQILCSINFFSEIRFVYEKMWKSIVERSRPQMAIWRMRIACWITKAIDTHRIFDTFHSNNDCMNAPQCYVYTYIVCLVRM